MTQNFGYDFVRLLVDNKLYGTNKKKWRGLINGARTTPPPMHNEGRGGAGADFNFLHFRNVSFTADT